MQKVLYVSNAAYDRLVTETVDELVQLGINKGGEYAQGTNRVENFVHEALEMDLLPEQVWNVYAAKHWRAINTYVKDLAKGTERYRSEPIEGRADDLMVYLLLFKALVKARRDRDGRFVLPDTAPVAEATPSFLTAVEQAITPDNPQPDPVPSANEELAETIAKSRRKPSPIESAT